MQGACSAHLMDSVGWFAFIGTAGETELAIFDLRFLTLVVADLVHCFLLGIQVYL